MDIRPLTERDAAACDAVIQTLPYHFGDEAGRAECALAVRSQPGYASIVDDELVGFVTTATWFDHAVEITWMAVAHRCRRRGIGRRLLDELVRDAADAGRRSLLVTTLSESTAEPGVEDGYSSTRRFYRANGFEPLWEPHGWWNDHNQAVLLQRRLP